MKMVLPRIGYLGVDCLNTTFIARALRDTKLFFISPVVTKGRHLGSVAHRGEVFQAEINADTAIANRQIIRNLALKDDVPAPARVFDKGSALNGFRDSARLPKEIAPLQISDGVSINIDGSGDKRHPAKLALGAKARSELGALPLAVPGYDKLPTNRANGVTMQSKIRTGARAKLDQVKGRRPRNVRASGAPSLRFTLGRSQKVPDLITRDRMPTQMLSGRRVLDTKLETENAHMRCSTSPTVARRSVFPARDRQLLYSTPRINQVPLLPAMNDGVSACGEFR